MRIAECACVCVCVIFIIFLFYYYYFLFFWFSNYIIILQEECNAMFNVLNDFHNFRTPQSGLHSSKSLTQLKTCIAQKKKTLHQINKWCKIPNKYTHIGDFVSTRRSLCVISCDYRVSVSLRIPIWNMWKNIQ